MAACSSTPGASQLTNSTHHHLQLFSASHSRFLRTLIQTAPGTGVLIMLNCAYMNRKEVSTLARRNTSDGKIYLCKKCNNEHSPTVSGQPSKIDRSTVLNLLSNRPHPILPVSFSYPSLEPASSDTRNYRPCRYDGPLCMHNVKNREACSLLVGIDEGT